MSREEAIYILRNAAWLGSNKEREKTEEAVEMAVKALEGKLEPRMPNICESCVRRLGADLVRCFSCGVGRWTDDQNG